MNFEYNLGTLSLNLGVGLFHQTPNFGLVAYQDGVGVVQNASTAVLRRT